MNLINQKHNIAIFASGTGSNFVNIFQNIHNKKLDANIKLLISNNKRCNAVKFAHDNGVNYKVINDVRFEDYDIDNVMLEILIKHEIDLIVLAGYMKKIPKKIIDYYNDRILNIHPALLPKFGGKGFYGMKVHEAVIKSKEKNTGITIHLVDNNYDTGSIIYQEKIKVLENDTAISISKKVLDLEHRLYPQVIKDFLKRI